jgi:hypothetical protein
VGKLTLYSPIINRNQQDNPWFTMLMDQEELSMRYEIYDKNDISDVLQTYTHQIVNRSSSTIIFYVDKIKVNVGETQCLGMN